MTTSRQGWEAVEVAEAVDAEVAGDVAWWGMGWQASVAGGIGWRLTRETVFVLRREAMAWPIFRR